MDVLRPGEGPLLCTALSASGLPCTHHEVEGMEFCVWHMPDDLLDEAEEITGWHRCRHAFPGPNACRAAAVKDTVPPRCQSHGANKGSLSSRHAASRTIERNTQDHLAEVMKREGEKWLKAPPVTNPLLELQSLAGRMLAMEQHLAKRVGRLKEDEWRWSGSRTGEQVRAEIILLERSQERLHRILVDMTRLGIEDRLARVDEIWVTTIERALVAALEASGLDLAGQHKARQVLRVQLEAG
jgi:hypothetical protein